MFESYSIAFMPGSSGRFISDVVWNLSHGVDSFQPFSMFNSNHNTLKQGQYKNTILYKDPGMKFNDMDYDKVLWNQSENTGLFLTHLYPDFTKIEKNSELDLTKFIIIKVDEGSMLECFANEMYKNHIQRLLGGLGVNFYPEWVYEEYVRNFGYVTKEDLPQQLKPDKIQVIILKLFDDYVTRSKDINHSEYRGDFLNPSVPEKYQQRTLILNYSDIFTETSTGYLALDKLAEFTNREPREYIKNKMAEYAMGRKDFIKNYLYNLIPI